MKTISLTIKASEGLHARPAHLFCDTANQFESDIQVKNATEGSDFVNAKSILSVLTLGVTKGHQIEVTADGPDEAKAIQTIQSLIENNFPDDE